MYDTLLNQPAALEVYYSFWYSRLLFVPFALEVSDGQFKGDDIAFLDIIP